MYRRSLLAVRLSVAIYDYGIFRGITHSFINCNDHLVDFFRELGFIPYLPKQDHEEYGAVTCIMLNVRDLAHLMWSRRRRMRSMRASGTMAGESRRLGSARMLKTLDGNC